MKFIIVGAGLGGLTAAYGFSRKGHNIILLEQRPAFAALGTGLAIRPGASRVLHSWGLRPDFEKIADPTTSFILRDVRTGNIMMPTIMTEVSEETDWATTRKDVMNLMYWKACDAGAQILFDVSIESLDENEKQALLTSKDGRTFSADIVLVADGIRSSLRRHVLADVDPPIDPIPSSTTLYGVDGIPLSILEARKDAGLLLESNFSLVWQGRDCSVVSRSRKTSGVFSGLFGIRADNDMERLWDERGDIEYVRNFFRSAGACQDLMAALDEANSCDRWKLAELPNLPRWISKGGRVALLGDSAHGMHPNAAMGYSLIVEEIGVLEYLVSRETRPAVHVPSILTTWQNICKPRAERVKAYARENTRVFQGEDVAGRSRVIKFDDVPWKSFKDVVPDMTAKFTRDRFVKWVYDYDPVAKAKEYIENTKPRL